MKLSRSSLDGAPFHHYYASCYNLVIILSANIFIMFRDFISEEQRPTMFKIGRVMASSLSGFLAGIIGGAIATWIILASRL